MVIFVTMQRYKKRYYLVCFLVSEIYASLNFLIYNIKRNSAALINLNQITIRF